jgi:vacuolar-type H+-ATPase subunit E/Vma4
MIEYDKQEHAKAIVTDAMRSVSEIAHEIHQILQKKQSETPNQAQGDQ